MLRRPCHLVFEARVRLARTPKTEVVA